MYQEILQFYHLWRLAVQERDEAKEHLKHSLAELSRLQELFNTILSSEEQKILHLYPETTDETTDYQTYSYNNFSEDSPLRFSSASSLDVVSNLTVNSSPEICDSDGYSFQSNQTRYDVENKRDLETIVLENIGGVLPERGKFLQAVTDAGQLVESFFITGQLPNWRNPPAQRQVTVGTWNSGGSELGSGIINRSFSRNMPRFSSMP